MKTKQIEIIDEMLWELPDNMFEEVKDYIGYLRERDKKRKAFKKRVQRANKEQSLSFGSVNELMKAIDDAA